MEIEIEDITQQWRPRRLFDLSAVIRLSTGNISRGHIFSDASVKDGVGGIGWWEYGSESPAVSGKLENPCSSTTAEMIAIKEAVKSLIKEERTDESFTIWTDSLQCLESLKKPITNRRETWLCANALNDLVSMGNRVKICWISKKAGAECMNKADSLARKGRDSRTVFHNTVQHKNNEDKLRKWEIDKKKETWRSSVLASSQYEMSKIMLSGFDDKRFRALPSLNRKNIRMVIAMCTGIAPLNSFLKKIYKNDPSKEISEKCRFCLDGK